MHSLSTRTIVLLDIHLAEISIYCLKNKALNRCLLKECRKSKQSRQFIPVGVDKLHVIYSYGEEYAVVTSSKLYTYT